jgi:hypothetical protein
MIIFTGFDGYDGAADVGMAHVKKIANKSFTYVFIILR